MGSYGSSEKWLSTGWIMIDGVWLRLGEERKNYLQSKIGVLGMIQTNLKATHRFMFFFPLKTQLQFVEKRDKSAN